MQNALRTLAAPHSLEEDVKKSRFIAYASRADDPDGARAFFQSRSHADASHNCWAYRIGTVYRFFDDGEPASTAGRPILAAIEGSGLDHVAVLVVRYFGGTKLGAGGLVRAYGGCAARCLQQCRVLEIQPRSTLDLRVPFDQLGAVYAVLERYQARRDEEHYEIGGVHLVVSLDTARVAELRQAMADATRGSAQLKVTSTPGNVEA